MRLRFLLYMAIFAVLAVQGQTPDNDPKQLYMDGQYTAAFPIFKAEYKQNPEAPALNHMLGVCAYETGDFALAEKCLAFASKKNNPDATLYLGELYLKMYRFGDAEKEFTKYEKAKRRDKEALSKLSEKRAYAGELKKLVRRTEDIQFIDSLTVAKSDFLSAYYLSASGGSLVPMNEFFGNRSATALPVFLNERKDRVYFSQSDSVKGLDIYSMEKLLNNFGNQKLLPENINDRGDQAYPFVMSDGLTTYFASNGHNSMGGYDLYVTRYNLSTDSYLNPNRLNMPFNSPFNDYLLVIDEEKGVGWFATDRFQPTDTVCIYTFIPNQQVTLVESEDENYLAQRAQIASLRDSWQTGIDYSPLVEAAKTSKAATDEKQQGDFELVIDNARTYRRLSDFRSLAAREFYVKAINLQKELNRNRDELSARREQYRQSSAAGKSDLSTAILALERDAEALHKQIQQLTLQSRNEEIRNTFN